MNLAKRIYRFKSSTTLELTALARKMKAEGQDVIELVAGEPDFPTPEHICEAAFDAIKKGFTKYTPSAGTDELRQAVAKKILYDYGIQYDVSEILVSCGAKHSLSNSLLSLVEEGDEVIIPQPYWVSYPDMAKLAGGTPILLVCEEKTKFKLTPDLLDKSLTPKTKVIIFNSPSNPTGAVYSESEIRALGEILKNHGCFILSDEIYKDIIYDGKKHFSFAQIPELKDRTLLVTGVSKAYSMTGWRIGFLAGNKEVVQAAGKIQNQSTSNPSSISQKASLSAISNSQECVKQMRNEFEKRRNTIYPFLNQIPYISCPMPEGAFYFLVNIRNYIGKKYHGNIIPDSDAICNYLLTECKLALAPGGSFGADDYVRISYAAALDQLEEGVKRLKKGLLQLT